MRPTLIAASLGSLVLLATTSVAAGDPYSDADFEVFSPFASSTARENFAKCYTTSNEDLEKLRTVQYWGYRFTPHDGCPPTNPSCEPTTRFFKLRRSLRTDASQGNPSNVIASIQSGEDHSCTSPREFSNYSWNITNKNAEYRWHARQRKRVCPFWGGSWTAGEGHVDVVSGVNLQPDFTLGSYTRLENESGKLFGFISGDFAVVLLAVALGPVGILTPALAQIFINAPMSNLRSDNFLGAGLNLGASVQDTPLGRIGDAGAYKIDLVTQAAESGFRLNGNELTVEILQDGYSPIYLEDNFQKIRKLEIDFLKSLPEVGPEKYIVQRGDSLWKIANAKFGDGRLFLYLKDYAHKRGSSLKLGEVLDLPRWHELCEKLKPNGLFVRDHESLWKKAKAGQIPFDFKRIKHRTRNADLIYPYETLAIAPQEEHRPRPVPRRR